MSPANVEFVLTHNPEISVDKVEVNPNSVEPVKYEESIDKCEIRKRYGLPLDVPVFIYGGNLGKPQGVSFLLEVLERNKERKDCYFLIVGNGTEYIRIKEWFGKCNVSNAQLLAGLPKQEYDQLVSSCDVGLIFLDPRFTIPNYPSRLLAYLESKMPVLAATDVNTDIGQIACDNGFGAWCESGDVNAFNRIMEIFFDEKLVRQMGEKGYEYLLENYTVSKTYEIIMQHLNKG